MYLRTTKRKNRDGSEVTYYQLAESVWNAEKRQAEAKVVHTFGRADEVDVEVLRRLSESIRRVCDGERAIPGGGPATRSLPAVADGLELLPAKSYGGLYVVEALWRRVGLDEILAKHAAPRRGRAPHVVALLAMVANRLLAPSSKLACYDTWLPRQAYFPEAAALKLGQLYRAMDFLAAHAERVEEALFFRVSDLFSLDVDLVFYDTTTAYFEIDDEDDDPAPGASESEPIREAAVRKRGHGKEGRNDPQVVVALAVTRNGLPVRSWVFPGNTVDVETVARVREDLRGWRLSRVLFVGDAGMYSEKNKKILSAGGGRYLLATPMRKVKEVYEEVVGRAGRYKELNEKLAVKEVVVGEGEARRRYFLCLNHREAERQKRHRKRILEMIEAELVALAKRKDDHPKAACRLMASQRFRPFLGQDEKGRPFIDRKKVEADERFDGKWVVTTNDDSLSAEDGALGYKAMMIIETCFRRMKTTGIKLRPMFHWTPARIVAHVKICFIALLLERLAEIACEQTWRKIRVALEEIQVIPCETPNGSFLKTTRLGAETLALLKKLHVPPPPRLLAVQPKSPASSET